MKIEVDEFLTKPIKCIIVDQNCMWNHQEVPLPYFMLVVRKLLILYHDKLTKEHGGQASNF